MLDTRVGPLVDGVLRGLVGSLLDYLLELLFGSAIDWFAAITGIDP